jgi:hypothetical protein
MCHGESLPGYAAVDEYAKFLLVGRTKAVDKLRQRFFVVACKEAPQNERFSMITWSVCLDDHLARVGIEAANSNLALLAI